MVGDQEVFGDRLSFLRSCGGGIPRSEDGEFTWANVKEIDANNIPLDAIHSMRSIDGISTSGAFGAYTLLGNQDNDVVLGNEANDTIITGQGAAPMLLACANEVIAADVDS